MKKIPAWLYLLFSAAVYFVLLLQNTFDLSNKIILTIVFAVLTPLHFVFLRTHYDVFLKYTVLKKVLLVVLSFVCLVTINFAVRFKLTSQINMVILFNACTLVFPLLMTIISVLLPRKVRLLSRILYYLGIVELFAGGFASIISIYFPALFIKG